MDVGFEWARALTAVSFLGFGLACLLAPRMELEFERYGLSRWRTLVGLLEICGALGLAVSPLFPGLLVPAAGGLCLLMVMGVLTRIRIRDSLAQMLPALVLLVLNAFLVAHALGSRAPV